MSILDEYVTTDEACAILGITRQALHKRFKSGTVNKYTVLGTPCYRRAELLELKKPKKVDVK